MSTAGDHDASFNQIPTAHALTSDNSRRNSQETLIPNGATSGDAKDVPRRNTESPGPMTNAESIIERGRRSPMADREIAQGVWEKSADRHDEVRDALGSMLKWVDELTLMLHTALREKGEIETTLRVTQSNLALALSNTEMLEAALKRDASGRRADVGWTRSASASSPLTTPLPGSPSTVPKSETGFFKFLRNNTGVNSPTAGTVQGYHTHHSSSGSTGRLHTPQSSVDGPTASPTTMVMKGQLQGLTSPSMPSLHSNVGGVGMTGSRREEELAQALQKEKASTAKALKEKQKLEEELETLSQALFEEANKMVATERMQKAQIEEELHNVQEEREALKGALKIVEGENATLRTGTKTPIKQASISSTSTPDASSVLRERSRALTIDTDRAEDEKPGIIDLSQTPSTSDIRETRATPDSDTKRESAVQPVEVTNPWNAPTPPTGPPNNVDSNTGFDYSSTVLRGGLTFGM